MVVSGITSGNWEAASAEREIDLMNDASLINSFDIPLLPGANTPTTFLTGVLLANLIDSAKSLSPEMTTPQSY